MNDLSHFMLESEFQAPFPASRFYPPQRNLITYEFLKSNKLYWNYKQQF